MLGLVALTGIGVLDYVAPMDSLLDLMAKEFPADFLHGPYLRVPLYLFHDLDLET